MNTPTRNRTPKRCYTAPSPSILREVIVYLRAEVAEDENRNTLTTAWRIRSARILERRWRQAKLKNNLWASYGTLNRDSYSVRAALKTPEGRDVVKRLQALGFKGISD
jgi:hypothetical protein